MARILVTGGSGLIGTAIVPALVADGNVVETLDLKGDPDWRIDITDKHACRSIDWSRYDGVIHLAAVSRVITAQYDPELTWRTNVEAVLDLLNTVNALKQSPWFLFASSREVYGQSSEFPVRETADLKPMNYYGYSKAFMERYISTIAATDMRCQVLRFSNAYGGVDDHADRVVPKFMRSALAGEPLVLEGSRNTFDFTYIGDVAKAVCLVVRRLNYGVPMASALNVATGVPTSLSELSAAIENVVGQKVKVVEKAERNFDVSRFVGSTDLLEQAVGWKPQTSLADGLAKFKDELMHDGQKTDD